MNELNEYKEKLGEVVKEVLYFEDQAARAQSRCKLLAQFLADSTAAHASTVSKLRGLIDVAAGSSAEILTSDHLDAEAENALRDLGSFQQELQRRLSKEKIVLPKASPLYQTSDTRRRFSPSKHSVKSPRCSSVHNLVRENGELLSRVRQLETELEHAKKTPQIHASPFPRDVRSEQELFGMSTIPGISSFSTTDIGQASETVESLKQRLLKQEQAFKREKGELLRKAEQELLDAETEIEQLRREVSPGAQVPRSSSSPRLKVGRIKIHRNGEVDLLELEDDSQVGEKKQQLVREGFVADDLCHRRQGSLVLQEERNVLVGLRKRVTELETLVASERVNRGNVEKKLRIAIDEKQRVEKVLTALELEQNLVVEETKTERSQAQSFKTQLEKAQRDRELLAREYRAAERRHEGVMDEMKQVLTERDKANSRVQELHEMHRAMKGEVEKAKTNLALSQEEKERISAEKEGLAQQAQALAREVGILKKQKLRFDQDMAIVVQQKETIVMERDAAVQEQQYAMKRVDEALKDRRRAIDENTKSLQAISKLEEANANLRVAQEKASCRIDDLRLQLGTVTENLENTEAKWRVTKDQLQEATVSQETLVEAKVSAEQDKEIAQRQCRSLMEELKSVLRVRDIALRQRDAALALQDQHHEVEKQEFASGNSLCSPSPSSANREGTNEMPVETRDKAHRGAAEEEETYPGKREASWQTPCPKNTLHDLDKAKVVSTSRRLVQLHQFIHSCTLAVQTVCSEAKGIKAIKLVAAASTQETSVEIFLRVSKQIETLEMEAALLKHGITALIGDDRSGVLQNCAGKQDVKAAMLAKNKELQAAEFKVRNLQESLDSARAQNADLRETVSHLTMQLSMSQSDIVPSPGADRERSDELLKARVEHLETLLGSVKSEKRQAESRYKKEIEEERQQLREALQRLGTTDTKLLDCKSKLRLKLLEIDRLQSDRKAFATDLDAARSRLQGALAQKENAAKEMKMVFESLNELESKLEASYAENRRLAALLGGASKKRASAKHSGRRLSEVS